MTIPSEPDNSILEQRKAKYSEDIDEFGFNEKDVEESYEVSPKFSSKTTDKITALKSIAENYEMSLRGRELETKNDKEVYVQKSRAIAGEGFIKLSGKILFSFSHESMLISNKATPEFKMQFIDAFNKVSSMIMRDRTISERNHRAILKIFKDRLWNLGDIITNTKGNMESIFGSIDDRENEEEDTLFGKGKK